MAKRFGASAAPTRTLAVSGAREQGRPACTARPGRPRSAQPTFVPVSGSSAWPVSKRRRGTDGSIASLPSVLSPPPVAFSDPSAFAATDMLSMPPLTSLPSLSMVDGDNVDALALGYASPAYRDALSAADESAGFEGLTDFLALHAPPETGEPPPPIMGRRIRSPPSRQLPARARPKPRSADGAAQTLTALHLRIVRCSQDVLAEEDHDNTDNNSENNSDNDDDDEASGAMVSAASTHVTELIAVTELFVAQMDGLGSADEAAVDRDASVLLMALCCHHQLLVTLETLCATIGQQLARRRRPQATLSASSSSASSARTAQAVMVVSLLRHLLARLDESLRGLAGPRQQQQQQQPPPPQPGLPSPPEQADHPGDTTTTTVYQSTATRIAGQLQRRRTSLQAAMDAAERLLQTQQREVQAT